MITIQLSQEETYDDESGSFSYRDGAVSSFEYSLLAISKWESRWKKPFLNSELSAEESMDFYKLMALDPIDDDFLTPGVMEQLSEYIKDPRTATTFTSIPGGSGEARKGKVYTAEEFYASMFASGVPLEFENRNFNTLLTILKVISEVSQPPKKMSNEEILRQNSSLNAQRKAALKTKG